MLFFLQDATIQGPAEVRSFEATCTVWPLLQRDARNAICGRRERGGGGQFGRKKGVPGRENIDLIGKILYP